jgi:hypothetical protein
LIYQTDGTSGFYFFNGLAWVNLGAGSVSSVGLTTGSAGTDIAVLGSPLSANGSITLNIPTSSATNRGVLSSTDWSTFNGKQATISATSPLTLTGTSIGIVNQGTSTTVLHGNAAGNASFGALSLESDVTGTLPIANGGTGQTTYTDGQLLIGNTTGNTLTKATLTAGNGITITNGNGRIEIAATPYTGTFIPTNFINTTTTTITATSSTAYTVPANVYRITIEAVGGSGGGGGSGGDGSSSNGRGGTGGGGGGGAGEYAGEIIAVMPGDIIDVTIGAAGVRGTAGGTNTSGGAGGDGGQTIVKLGSGGSTILTASGGKGGGFSPSNNTSNSTAGGAAGLGGTGSSAGQQSNGSNGTAGGASSGNGSGNAGTGGSGPQPTNLSSNVGGDGGAGVYRSTATSSGNQGAAGANGRVVISYSAY